MKQQQLNLKDNNSQQELEEIRFKINSQDNSLNDFKTSIERTISVLCEKQKDLCEKQKDQSIEINNLQRRNDILQETLNIKNQDISNLMRSQRDCNDILLSSQEVQKRNNEVKANETLNIKNQDISNLSLKLDNFMNSQKESNEILLSSQEVQKRNNEVNLNKTNETLNSMNLVIEANSKKIEENRVNINNNDLLIKSNIEKINNLNQNYNSNNREILLLNDSLTYVTNAIPKEVLISTKFANNYDQSALELSYNGKTMKKKITNNAWNGIYCHDKVIFNNTIHEFSLQINSVSANAKIRIGFSVGGLDKIGGLVPKAQSWGVHLNEEHIFPLNFT